MHKGRQPQCELRVQRRKYGQEARSCGEPGLKEKEKEPFAALLLLRRGEDFPLGILLEVALLSDRGEEGKTAGCGDKGEGRASKGDISSSIYPCTTAS